MHKQLRPKEFPMRKVPLTICTLLLVTIACNGSHVRLPASSSGDTAVPVQPPVAVPPSTPQPIDSTPEATATPAVTTGARDWSFDADSANAPPPGFSFSRTGSGAQGRWVIHADTGAPSGSNVLAQLDANATDYRFPIAVANEPLLRDGSVSVRCKPVSGKVDQACGLVFRYRDADNYYVTRANALENNVRLYHVVKGDRQQFAGWNGKVSTGHWHSLRVDAKRDHFEVYWEDKKVIDAHDATFSEAGKIGVWTKADSITYFDDLRAEPTP